MITAATTASRKACNGRRKTPRGKRRGTSTSELNAMGRAHRRSKKAAKLVQMQRNCSCSCRRDDELSTAQWETEDDDEVDDGEEAEDGDEVENSESESSDKQEVCDVTAKGQR